MAGRVVVEIERDGEVVPVTKLAESEAEHETGIVLDGETSASPRGLGIDIRPLSAGTRVKFKEVQQRHGWVNPVSFKLHFSREDSKLVIEGVDEDSFPEGKYELKLRLGGLKLKPTFPKVTVPKNGDVKLRLKEKVYRKLVLNRPVEDFDEHSRRILTHGKSMLDGMDAASWLTGAKHRDHRKAVLLNVLAKLNAIPMAKPEKALARHVEHVFFAEIDRIYCAVSGKFHEAVKEEFKKDKTIAATHRRLLTRLPGNGDDFDLMSYREPTRRGSLQAVVAVPKAGAGSTHYVDLDIDGANPGQDLVTFLIHVGEILDPDKTNHLRLVKRLDRRQVGDFLYYDVEKV